MGSYIFISYSSKDKKIADAICHFLEENGIPCWVAPRDILAGETWAGAIVKAIKSCGAMILIYSENSNSSMQVANEVDKAFSYGKIIIPFMMDATPLNDDFEYYLSRKHWLIAYPDFRKTFGSLLNSVRKIIPENVGCKSVALKEIQGSSFGSNRNNEAVCKPALRHICNVCGYLYDSGILVPERCVVCGAPKHKIMCLPE